MVKIIPIALATLFLILVGSVSCDYTLTYSNGEVVISYVNATTFKVTLKGKLDTWLGIGFGKRMKNTDMHMASFVSSSSYVLSDTYCTGYAAPTDDTSLGGTNDLKNVTYTTASDGSPQIEYFRLLNTGDQYDATLTWNTTQSLIVAWGSLPISFHGGNYLTESFLFSNSTSSTSSSTSSLGFWNFHGISLLVVWTVFNFFGYIFARFFKHLSWWMWVHNIGSGFTAFFSIVVLFASLALSTDYSNSTSYSIHSFFGGVLLILIGAQFLAGLINYFFIYKRKRFQNDFIHKFKKIHRYLGIFLTFTVYINIITGFIVYWNDLIALPAILCSLCLSIITFWELLHLINNFCKKTEALKDYFDEVEEIKKLNHEKRKPIITLEQLNAQKSRRKFVLFENYVCDVTDFIDHHPGGAMIIEDNLYADVGRYLTGTQAYNKHFNNYDHYLMTHKHLIDQMTFAEIKDKHNLLVVGPSVGNPSEVLGYKDQIENYINADNVVISEKREIAKHVCEFKIGGIQKTVFARFLPGVFWMGRHFSVSSSRLNKTRYYSICLSLDEVIKKKHLALLNNIFYLEKKEAEKIVDTLLKEDEKTSENLHLYIKEYPSKKALSSHIHNHPLNTQSDLIIRGPCGVGLNLFDNKLQGSYVIFSAGTGIFPFLDLIAYTARYAAYKVASEHFDYTDNLLVPNEVASFQQTVGMSFKLHVFVSFANPESAIFLDVMERLQHIDKQYKLGLFKLHTRISSKNKQRWDAKFIKECLAEYEEEINSVMIVGPTPFMDDIKRDIISSGVAVNEQILLV